MNAGKNMLATEPFNDMKFANAERILVHVRHPHGDQEIPLSEWMKAGPGERPLVRPSSARDASTGANLPMSVIPLPYRNNALSRFLIRLGFLRNPWSK